MGEGVEHLLPQLARARLEQRVGDLDGGVGDRGIQRRLTELGLDALLVGLAQARADVLAELVERVEARLGGEVVVERRELLRLELLDGDGEGRLLAREVGRAVVVRKGDRDGAVLAGRCALELFLEARHEAARAELDHLVAPLAAGEPLAVERAHEVHHDEVAALGGALDGLQAPGALAQPLDLLVDRLVRNRRLALADLELLVLPEHGLRAHADLDGELQRLALARQVAHVEVRLADGHDGGRGDRGAVPRGDRVAHRLVEDCVAADALDDDGGGRLAGAEAGDAHGAAELARGLRDALLDLLGGDLRLDAHARVGELGDGGGDGNGHGRQTTIPSPNAPPARRVGRVRAAWTRRGRRGRRRGGAVGRAARAGAAAARVVALTAGHCGGDGGDGPRRPRASAAPRAAARPGGRAGSAPAPRPGVRGLPHGPARAGWGSARLPSAGRARASDRRRRRGDGRATRRAMAGLDVRHVPVLPQRAREPVRAGTLHRLRHRRRLRGLRGGRRALLPPPPGRL